MHTNQVRLKCGQRGGSMIRNSHFFRAVTAAAIIAVCLADGEAAQFPDKLGARAVWREPAGAGTSNCEGRNNDFHRQLGCVARIMKSSGATAEAIEFAQRYSTQSDEICYLSKLQPFGPVSLATLALPFRRNTNAHTDNEYAIVNGAPSFIRVDDTGAVQSALADRPVWLRLKREHPDIDVWEGTVFAGGGSRAGGGYRLVFSYPLGTYHAEAGRWNASIAFDFAADGTFYGRRLLAITGPQK